MPIYAADPQDTWNRLHHLLFSRVTRRVMSSYFRDGTPARLETRLAGATSEEERRRFLGEARYPDRAASLPAVVRRIGGDAPDFFLYHDVGFLLQDGGRLLAIERLLTEADTGTFIDGRSTVARILLQQDLWNRFDELDSLARYEKDPKVGARARRLQILLGRAIVRVACRPEDLARVPSNFAAIAGAYGMIDSGLFSAGSPWREIVPVTSSPTGSTAHSFTAGHRRVFRVFLRVPPQAGGAPCLEEYFRRYDRRGDSYPELPCFPSGGLAPGTRAMLVETLLALGPTGEIVPLPLIFSIQVREIQPLEPGADGRFTLDDIPFFVFHGSRLLLVRSGVDSGGLVALSADAPVPPNVSAFGSGAEQPLVPARLACPQCHDPTGQHLMTVGFHGIVGVRVLHPGNTIQQEAVLRAKRKRDDYRDLRLYFPAD